jgi:hypothetical protein
LHFTERSLTYRLILGSPAGTGTQTDRYWNHSWYIWNNTGDTAALRNHNGTTIDSCTYKGTSQGYVFC